MAGYQPPGNLSQAQTDLCAAENDPIKFRSKLPSAKPWCALTAKWLRTSQWREGGRRGRETASCFRPCVLLSLQILVPVLADAAWPGRQAR